MTKLWRIWAKALGDKSGKTDRDVGSSLYLSNGGDRGKTNTPEFDRYKDDPRVRFEFGIGGTDKMNSSSWILHGYFERQRKLLGI